MQVPKPLTENRRLMLAGYLCLLNEAKPNGRYIHEVGNKRAALIGSLKLGIDVAEEYEQQIKDLIHSLYGDTGERIAEEITMKEK